MLAKPSKQASSNKMKRVLPPFRRTFPEVLRDLLICLLVAKLFGVKLESLPVVSHLLQM